MASWPARLRMTACVLFVFGAAPVFAQRIVYEAPFSGQPLGQFLQRSASITCRSELADSTGYYPKGSGHSLLSSGLEKQSKPASWRLSLVGDEEAVVVPGQGGTPERFQVIRRDSTSIILARVGQGLAGGTVEILMIDPQNGSFVASDSSVGPLWNRTTVWVGRCE